MTLMFNPHHEIASIAARFAPGEGEFKTAIEGLGISRRSMPSAPCHASYRPCFAMVIQGAKSLQLGTDTINYGAGDYLLTSLDLPVAWRVVEASPEVPHFCITLAISPEKLLDLLSRTDIQRPAEPAVGQRGMMVNIATPELLDAAVRLLRLLDNPSDIPAMAPLLEQEILYRILTGPAGGQLINIAVADNHGHRIARAVAWLRENFARPLRIEELAEHVNMSVSSFHHHFKAITAMTPVQYQKQLRLHEARRLMLIERLDVGTAGHRVGYQSPSQFSREYSRLYGLSPLRDVEGMRGPIAAE
ncbi:AraC family transcriptional regulator [Rhizobium sp. VS19-DR104.2]|uniref:AraC family transcriptional regulator n=1 Tax=unclassified Rhizobium TaxID=2613769 RepID=UPI001C5B154A|nr:MULTISPECIES: AraC family transcriptional regulator [unclassified Rhizobium]MBZ5758445.1 AraC family transcriptional regulator [Rhizobium sp. VS19-DR96]MBZ5764725.1 AraC family transcriptional regulator [Rhizobium sp. VS19-DR129.2]MBZ5772268.1 AraC family transcriptional regulator [Rhizobium sp. VS19-DRK62.2]MBZ5783045.1 AraC family transcriptional regulator [Rhizobium sp. VS19-DR121]MBZ5800493.1 AraC family transcriptional regulator [Rhizobium sp. VS19-DR181]